MKTTQGTAETNPGQERQNVGTIWLSAAVSAACFTFYFAEDHGFRLFEESVRNPQIAEAAVPSPLEILTVLGVTSIGVCAGLIALISLVIWFVQQARPSRETLRKDEAHAGPEMAAPQSAA